MRMLIYTCNAILLFGLSWTLDHLIQKTDQNIAYIRDRATKIDKLETPTVLNPHIDIKAEILRVNPRLPEIASSESSLAESLGARGAFHAQFNYSYLLDDFESLAEAVQSYGNYTHAVDHLDFTFLLPAYLYERMGFQELAHRDYSRYLMLARDASITGGGFASNSMSRRLTTVRTKLEFLKGAIPSLRDEYYKGSYFSSLISDFFEVSLNKRRFLGKYVRAGLISKPRVDTGLIFVRTDELKKFVASAGVGAAPYAHYEVCASHMWGERGNIAIESCDLRSLVDTLPDGHYLRYLGQFLIAQLTDDESEAQAHFKDIRTTKDLGAAEYLRDDAFFFEALSYYRTGRQSTGTQLLSDLVKNFDAEAYDAVSAARRELSWQTKRSELERAVERENILMGGGAVFLQIGAFQDRNNAYRLAEKVKLALGVSANIAEEEVERRIYFRVLIGPFLKKEDVEAARSDLSRMGISKAVEFFPANQ